MASMRIRLWPRRIDDGTEMKLLDVGQFTEFSLKNEKRKGEKKIILSVLLSRLTLFLSFYHLPRTHIISA